MIRFLCPTVRVLKTLHDAGHYAAALAKAVQERAEWQTAAEMLILAAQGQRPVMFAPIAMLKALHASAAATAETGQEIRTRSLGRVDAR
jgi:hypothetical protein